MPQAWRRDNAVGANLTHYDAEGRGPFGLNQSAAGPR
jgi:hypothetical protein